jgi:ankyrin repeat protein
VYDWFVFCNYICQAGADVNGFGSYNPLAKAAKKGLTEAIKCLLEAGADPNVSDTVRIQFCCISVSL